MSAGDASRCFLSGVYDTSGSMRKPKYIKMCFYMEEKKKQKSKPTVTQNYPTFLFLGNFLNERLFAGAGLQTVIG